MTQSKKPGTRRQQQKAESREKVVTAAAQLFRDKGLEGAGIAEIMKAAGLTHGGFYAHFTDKEALLSEAITQAMTQKRSDWFSELDALPPEDQLKRVSRRYLSKKHRDLRDDGCALAALGGELGRAGKAPQAAMGCELRKARDRLADLINRPTPGFPTFDRPPADTPSHTPSDTPSLENLSPKTANLENTSPQTPSPEAKERALALFALYVGGIVVARAVGDGGLSDEVIEACRQLADREVEQAVASTATTNR